MSIPRLKTGVRRACFHSDGNERFRIQKLIKLVTFSARTGDSKRKIRGEMPSTPTAFLGLRWSKMLRIYEQFWKIFGNLRKIVTFYIIKRRLHGRLEIRNLSSRVEKYFTRLLSSLVKYFSTLEDKFRISARPCNILYV